MLLRTVLPWAVGWSLDDLPWYVEKNDEGKKYNIIMNDNGRYKIIITIMKQKLNQIK